MEKGHRELVEMNLSQPMKAEWLPKLRTGYARRSREGKSRMLDELCEDYDYERTYAIKLLRDSWPVMTGRRPPGSEPRYGLIEPIVRQLWPPCRATLREAPGAYLAPLVGYPSMSGAWER
jgi:hypothetical protein